MRHIVWKAPYTVRRFPLYAAHRRSSACVFRSAFCQAHRERARCSLSTGAPFKVLDGVVGLVAVDAARLRLAIVVRHERLCDKPADALCSRCAHVAQQNKMVSACVRSVGKNLFRLHAMEASIRPANRAFETFDATATGYLTAPFAACYAAPFLHRMHLLRLALPRNGHPITC